MEKKIFFEVSGKLALFTDPITRIGGEKMSYQIPTYSALKGICEAVYWKPTIEWVIDRVRVMNKIETYSYATNNIFYYKPNHNPTITTYLKKPRYQIEAHIEWNMARPDMKEGRIEAKHYEMAVTAVKRGGRKKVFLGTSECIADVVPCVFGADEGYYDQYDEVPFSCMVHSLIYNKSGAASDVLLWSPTMKSGVIDFIRPNECKLRKHLILEQENVFAK